MTTKLKAQAELADAADALVFEVAALLDVCKSVAEISTRVEGALGKLDRIEEEGETQLRVKSKKTRKVDPEETVE